LLNSKVPEREWNSHHGIPPKRLQEFYLIQWAGPQVMESYADTPQGCEEHPDATWEPDECLPDELDVIVACIYSTENAYSKLSAFCPER